MAEGENGVRMRNRENQSSYILAYFYCHRFIILRNIPGLAPHLYVPIHTYAPTPTLQLTHTTLTRTHTHHTHRQPNTHTHTHREREREREK